MTFGERVRMLRLHRGMSLQNLATKTGLSLSFLCRVELNKVNPTKKTMENIAYELGAVVSLTPM